ncbi:MAG: DUF1385 domain-containing protein, partial [FCB group bacterium]|nr:DUF1385 domain-containing protein [FCB group bacterium]
QTLQNDDSISVGGQAVIEGVMMRSPVAVATAVRKSDGSISINHFLYKSLTKRKKFWGLPVIRGAVSLVEALYLGIKTLNWSAEEASEEEETKKKSRLRDTLLSALSIIIALAGGLALFMLLPYWVTGLIRDAGGSQFIFHAAAGLIRIILFLLYLLVISRWKEIARVFQYHGAEHKSIFAFEREGEVSVESAKRYSRFHPRCGTSFLLITAIIVIFLFAVIDSIIVPVFGEYRSPLHRLLAHLPFIPLVAGVAYEILKLSGKKQEQGIWRHLIKPGLWLQHITTNEPDEKQLEVAAAALKASLRTDEAEADSANLTAVEVMEGD